MAAFQASLSENHAATFVVIFRALATDDHCHHHPPDLATQCIGSPPTADAAVQYIYKRTGLISTSTTHL